MKRAEIGRGWDSPEARVAARDDLLRRAERVSDLDEAADLREQAAELDEQSTRLTITPPGPILHAGPVR